MPSDEYCAFFGLPGPSSLEAQQFVPNGATQHEKHLVYKRAETGLRDDRSGAMYVAQPKAGDGCHVLSRLTSDLMHWPVFLRRKKLLEDSTLLEVPTHVSLVRTMPARTWVRLKLSRPMLARQLSAGV